MGINASATKDVCLTARWIMTMTGPPQQGGWIRMCGERVLEVQTGKPPTEVVDLGDVAILPGLINAHTHLEFSDIESPIGNSEDGRSEFPLHDWIGHVVRSRQNQTGESVAQAILKGWRESQDAGVRWLADIATPPHSATVAAILQAAQRPTEYCGLAEVIGLSNERWQERWQQAAQWTAESGDRGFSPHAPYSTSTDAIQNCVTQSIERKRLMAMHVAESPEERDLICEGNGPFAEALVRMGAWQPGLFPRMNIESRDEAFQGLIDDLAKSWKALIVHGNDLTTSEIAGIAKHANLSVVYCPRTHHFFRHNQHPVGRMLAAGVRVVLGTDSRASNPDLNLWSEVQHILNHRQDIAPEQVLAMPTVNASQAIGRSDLGAIRLGSVPGLATVTTTAVEEKELYEDLAENPYQPITEFGEETHRSA